MAEGYSSLPEGFESWSRTAQVKYIGEKWLEREGAISPEETRSGKEIVEGTKVLFPELIIPENSVFQYLSALVRDPESRINTKDRREGFYLSDAASLSAAQAGAVANAPDVSEQSSVKAQRERALYPVFQQWLLLQGNDQVGITAEQRNRDLGTWSNPDLTGVRVHESLGQISEVEITTIEVKQTAGNWQYDIFEAVAHIRFANRAYFAFAHPDETVRKLSDDMRGYAELYGPGILVLPMAPEAYDALTTGSIADIGELYASDIIELYTPRRYAVNHEFRGRFLAGIGIATEKQLSTWGERIR
ncbi:MAG: hypothetical protein EA427_02115 [Spirochaetaceae bacterium]|nr:MAG: hypothetical protein EA427_02115 [Spirochaetaceae bacterium]